jgi:hypothetical protein
MADSLITLGYCYDSSSERSKGQRRALNDHRT